MSLILDETALAEVVQHYSCVEAFAFDVETIGDYRGTPMRNDVLWISLATDGRADVIPMGHPHGEFLGYDKPLTSVGKQRRDKGLPHRDSDVRKTGWTKLWGPAPEQLTPAVVFKALEPILFGSAIKVAQNLKFDVESVAKYYSKRTFSPLPYFDTMVATLLINSLYRGKANLAAIAMRECGYPMTKGIGKEIEIHAFSEAYRYSFIDAKYTYLARKSLVKKLAKKKMTKLMALEMDLMEAIIDMELTGAPIDKGALQVLHDRLVAELGICRTNVYRAAGFIFNINSDAEVRRLLYTAKKDGGHGLTPKGLTKTGIALQRAGNEPTLNHYAVDNAALAPYAGKNSLVDALIAHNEIDKLFGTYVLPYNGGVSVSQTEKALKTKVVTSLLIDSRVHGKINQLGTDTGRASSCVSGDTYLPTSRGTFRFDEYIPQEGDRVLTHTCRWMPVLRKVYKGQSEMFRVTLDNGAVLHCTNLHRLLSLDGWVALGDLRVGNKVASYVSVKSIYIQTRESNRCASSVFSGRQTDDSECGQGFGSYGSECDSCSEDGTISRAIGSREGSQVLQKQIGYKEPYEGQEWFPSPQLRGSNIGWTRVSDGEGGAEICLATPPSDGSGAWSREASVLPGRSSYRYGQDEQLLGQSRIGDNCGSWKAAQCSAGIAEIVSVGTMGVWDIEVEGDNSYLTQGFVNHNSGPNLQNAPNPGKTENGKEYRNIFVAPPGCRLIVADYSQIEPRVMADLSGDKILCKTYRDGGDIYLAIAERMSVSRPVAKILVLAISYGTGVAKIMEVAHCNKAAGDSLLLDFKSEFHAVMTLQKSVIREARLRKPHYVTTILNRRRYIPELSSTNEGLRKKAERQAFNTKIQGSAADIIKLAMVRAYRSIPPEAKMILTVHDEIVSYAPDHLIEETVEAIRSSMEDLNLLSIPLIADIKVVDKWGEAK